MPTSMTPQLQGLLHGMLTKDPSKRLTLEEIRCHDWTTDGQRLPSLCHPKSIQPIQVSDEEKKNAFTPLKKLHMVLRIKMMTDKWRRRAGNRFQAASPPPLGPEHTMGTTETKASSNLATPV